MAAGKERIDYNYREMIELSAELSEIAEELNNIKAAFDGMLNHLGGIWQGKSSEDYRNQGAGVSQFMGQNAASLKTIASGIKSTAKTYREAEYQKLEE